MISISSKRAHVWLIVTLVISLAISRIRLLIAWNIPLKIATKPLPGRYNYYWEHIKCRQRPIPWYHRRPPTTFRLATIPDDWHAVVHYDPLRSSRVNDSYVIWKPICDLLLIINSNLSLISHRLATIHLWRTTTNRRQTDENSYQKLDRYLSTVG